MENSEWQGFFEFKPTQVLHWLLNSPCKITVLFTGNQFGKNECIMMDYILRILGKHPNPNKNVKPDDKIRTFRFASENLPGEKDENEVKNTQYPVLKRRLPLSLIDVDITARNKVVTVACPGGGKVQLEFVSFSQSTQSTAGQQRKSVWLDEEASKDFYEEQIPRLLAADGDMLLSFTPVPGAIGWMFDEMFERAKYIYRTPAVRARLKERFNEDKPECEITDSKDDICVIMAATDDNPMYKVLAEKKSVALGRKITAKEYLDAEFGKYGDEDVVDARRYGMFRQLSGKIHKSFTPTTHVISYDKYFPEGVPNDWKHFRGIDYHDGNPWAVVWASVSPQNEMFVWCDYAPQPGRMITYDIALNIARMSGDYKYLLNLIDPLANAKQINTNLTTIEDMNRYFNEFKKDNIGTGGYWQPWDTKGTRGREEVTMRLLNSIKVGKPYNNRVVINDRAETLPTLWITNNCQSVVEAMKNWRREDWASRQMLMKNDQKDKPQQKWSHFPITIECLLKNPMVSRPRWGDTSGAPLRPKHYL